MTATRHHADSRTENRRRADHPIHPVFLERWSPRAFDDAPMPAGDLLTLLEAARWAPSAYNIQPWRFVYTLRDDACWQTHLGLLDPFNADWARAASALVFIVSQRLTPAADGRPPRLSRTHSFDAGAAWAQLALQATLLGYQAHAMAGIRFDDAARELDIPADFQLEIAVAIGRLATAEGLPPALQARETPSTRRPLAHSAFAGRFAAIDAEAV